MLRPDNPPTPSDAEVAVEVAAPNTMHESFTNYSESLFTECRFGKTAGAAYVLGTRKNVKNDQPIVGQFGVNDEGSGDMYYKGDNLLHTIRQLVDDDAKWRDISTCRYGCGSRPGGTRSSARRSGGRPPRCVCGAPTTSASTRTSTSTWESPASVRAQPLSRPRRGRRASARHRGGELSS
jgi:hypothetical protein